MNSRIIRLTLGFVLAAMPVFVAGCGSSSGSGSYSGGTQTGSVDMMVSDASTEDWATIGIKILSISLIPQNGGSNVNVYTAPTPAPMINLVQLDQLGEILGNVTVPVGTYTGAVITISGNPSDFQLTPSADPSAAFLALGTAGTAGIVPASQIDVQGATGSPATVAVTVNFVSPLVVTANGTNALDLEIDLSHPAFLIGHLAGGPTVWAVNFKGPWHHHPIPDVTKFLLRDIYGTVTAVNSDGSLTITRDFPAEPAAATATSEGPISTTHSITILPDATNGTLFYDVDNPAQDMTIKSYSTVSGDLPMGEFVRVTARFQTGGTLVAVRTWASSSFGNIYVSPEGHVLHVNTMNNTITVENEVGVGVPLQVTSNTTFLYDGTQIGQGIAFLTNLERGFKVHASVVFPLTSPLTADQINIEIARYDGTISIPNASTTTFTYSRNFNTGKDDYVVTLPYISPSTANGKDPLTGNPITGFKWWNFTFPTIVDSDSANTVAGDGTVIADFVKATNGTTISFGGTAPPVTATGESYAVWGDPAAMTGWSAPWTVLDPTHIQLGTAKTGYLTGDPGSFTMVVPLGPTPVTINMATVTGSGTLVYQVSRSGLIVTVTPEDITTSQGQSAVAATLLPSTPVDVYGIPQPDGTIKAYVVLYYTGVMPTAVD